MKSSRSLYASDVSQILKRTVVVNSVISSQKSDLLMMFNFWTLYFLFSGKTFSIINFHLDLESNYCNTANTAKHVVDNKVVTVTFTLFQDKICAIGEEQIMTFLENHHLSQLSVQSFFEKMCQIQERRATDQQFKVKDKAYSWKI